ncbi:predicted protein [Uncinocarpus reesii 1704]|uniref:Uncharacterized protein n=1 Tax=Uncinocarpus reesii (strain UAMH 1704) TaxID=336963 RepID=C4JW41_UNCRE|nr:uncharacterized protein UREG_06783 [Uncinocarpus reesii 1704]EEP81918.1 predicted protein [Uncinocarpus reesii 1704]
MGKIRETDNSIVGTLNLRHDPQKARNVNPTPSLQSLATSSAIEMTNLVRVRNQHGRDVTRGNPQDTMLMTSLLLTTPRDTEDTEITVVAKSRELSGRATEGITTSYDL